MSPSETKAQPRILDLAIAVAAIVMVLGILGGVLAMIKLNFSSAGMCLLAAGVTAGLLANAVLRD